MGRSSNNFLVSFGLLVVVLCIFVGVSWVVNAYKFTQLDFEPSYKAEILRGAGFVTPIFPITAWMDIGEENNTENK